MVTRRSHQLLKLANVHVFVVSEFAIVISQRWISFVDCSSDRIRWIEAFDHVVDSDTAYEISGEQAFLLFRVTFSFKTIAFKHYESNCICYQKLIPRHI